MDHRVSSETVFTSKNPALERGLLPEWSRAIELFFLKNAGRLAWVHAAMFMLFLIILFVPLFLPEAPENATPWSNFTVFSNYLMWGIWFPLVFFSVIVTGRSWCGLLCPMGASSEWSNKIGFKRNIPGWLRWEGTPITSFLVITILGQTVGVRDHPEALAGLFGGTLLVAIVIGFLYGKRRRAWCRHMCPIGLLLGIFSRLGAVEFAPKVKKAGGDRWVEKGFCPTMIDIVRKEESRHCIECFRCCHKDEKKGLQLRFRLPGEEVANIRLHHPNLYETFFLFIGTGIALGGFLWLVLPIYQELRQTVGIWALERDMTWIGESGPAWLMSVHPERREVFLWLDFFMIVGFMLAVTLAYVLALSTTTWLSALLAGRFGADGTLKQRFTELGYQYAPVAMVSLIIGLGAKLFDGFGLIGIPYTGVAAIKGLLFVLALGWSIMLSIKILNRQGLRDGRVLIATVPGFFGSLLVGAGWWSAVIGF
jgi:polyferredoxin